MSFDFDEFVKKEKQREEDRMLGILNRKLTDTGFWSMNEMDFFSAEEERNDKGSVGSITEEGHKEGQRAWIRKGGVVVEPLPNELFIDIDDKWQYDDFADAFKHLRMNCYPNARAIYLERSRNISGKKDHPYHIIIDLGFNVGQFQRVALQAMLQSDPRREIISLGRILNGITNPTLFFEKKEAAEKIERARQRAYGNSR